MKSVTLRRTAVVATVLAVATTATLFALTEDEAESVSAAAVAPPAPAVTVSSPRQRTLVEAAEITGRIHALEMVDLRAEVPGRLDAVHFQSGQVVQQGDLLFTLDARTYAAAHAAAAAAVVRAEATATTARRDADRADLLLSREAISTEEADTRRARAAEAEANLLVARAERDRTAVDLERTSVRAPITGRVSRALVTTGNLVSPATPLTTLVSVGDAYVHADVDEATVLRLQRLLREGQVQLDDVGRIPVDMQLADEAGFPRHGFVESLDNHLDPTTGSLTVRMVFPNTGDALTPGLFARVRLPLGSPEPALLISERAIGTDQSQKFVLVVGDDNTVAYRPITLGPVVDGERVIRTGLQPEDRVIVNGLQRVRPGTSVTVETAALARSS
ncbi:efflux RND transporter periplasmic adaptor subunit [Synoicihabitans lomoniglobus]|uniref:Efflux RND transporter periplasmic adaptor subunit n=1 Tax=Synoicihabitans lomoniglobus TaxID=2909285 RepID=A0AAF0CMQ8_9BACT|nr:efflux RND transporter periplasmic adaptor subunit [Opitutaceae bacterium LMO-M01]WED63651.1 efflux RND transporter periplasmic adaptor subunit [Opitutaceae bacterium LMO-M01]